jgi:hypothetical protein
VREEINIYVKALDIKEERKKEKEFKINEMHFQNTRLS